MEIKKTFSEELLRDVNIEEYVGIRYQLSDGKGNLLEDTDTRDILHEMANRIIKLRESASEYIEQRVAESDKDNAALGLLTSVEIDEVKAHITSARNVYQERKAQILACNSLEELEQLNWSN